MSQMVTPFTRKQSQCTSSFSEIIFRSPWAMFSLVSEDHSLKELSEALRDCLSLLSGYIGETEALRGTQLGSITLSQD